jgi:hypothetical protein
MVTRALLYATFNGVADCTNGIGRQTQTLLGALAHRWAEVAARVGSFTPYLAIPAPGPRAWAYDPGRRRACEQLVAARGGQIIPLGHDTGTEFWSPPVWRQLSADALVAEMARLRACGCRNPATTPPLNRHRDQRAHPVRAIEPYRPTGNRSPPGSPRR